MNNKDGVNVNFLSELTQFSWGLNITIKKSHRHCRYVRWILQVVMLVWLKQTTICEHYPDTHYQSSCNLPKYVISQHKLINVDGKHDLVTCEVFSLSQFSFTEASFLETVLLPPTHLSVWSSINMTPHMGTTGHCGNRTQHCITTIFASACFCLFQSIYPDRQQKAHWKCF